MVGAKISKLTYNTILWLTLAFQSVVCDGVKETEVPALDPVEELGTQLYWRSLLLPGSLYIYVIILYTVHVSYPHIHLKLR